MSFVMTSPSDYPLSDDFLSEMPAAMVQRLRDAGWQRPRTVFFEIPYRAISAAGVGVARDYEHRLIYETFHATTGVVAQLTDAELRVVVDHEQEEAASAVDGAMSGRSGMTTLTAEAQRHEPEIVKLERVHGEDTVRNTLIKASQVASLMPAISRLVLFFWECRHFTANLERYERIAVPMNECMLSRAEKNKFMQLLSATDHEYSGRLPFEQLHELLRSLA
jgi:hypothetical protein